MENRDRPVEEFTGNDLRVVDDHLVALYDFRSKGIVCGYSLRTGVFGGLTNVLGLDAPGSRGALLRYTLAKAESTRDATETLARKASTGYYRPANYVLGGKETLAKIESFGRMVHVEEGLEKVVATNHFHHLSEGKKSNASVAREKIVHEKLGSISQLTMEKLASLAKSHASKGPVCRHGRTLASMILDLPLRRSARLLFSTGPPCKGYGGRSADDFPTSSIGLP